MENEYGIIGSYEGNKITCIYTKKCEINTGEDVYIQTKKRCVKLDDLIDMIEEILDRKIL